VKPEDSSKLPLDPALKPAWEWNTWKLYVLSFVFALCIVPSLVSYAPYSFRWDDSDYLSRSVAVSKAFWSGNAHQMRTAMVSGHPPVMTLLALPWGPLTTWDAAGKCLITLTGLTALLVACCMFLLLRVGLQPLYLLAAGACVFAALGPYPAGARAHSEATAFMVDSLFAWSAFAAVLLIPYESANPTTSSLRESLMRGALWAAIFSVGALTKLTFLYFIALTVPVLLAIRVRQSGPRNAFLALASLTGCSLPAITYWLRYGREILSYGQLASFGHTADFYFVSFPRFVSETLRQSPGMFISLIFTIVVGAYLVIRRADLLWGTNLLPILILIGYCTICLASKNREIRFLFPGIIAFPFLAAILISTKPRKYSRTTALMMATIVLCVLVLAAIPMRHRPDRECLSASEAVLAQAAECNARRLLLATDSSSLNLNLLELTISISPLRNPIETNTLSWKAALGAPIEEDLRVIRESDLVVFQNKEALDSPPTNLRVREYEQYARQQFGAPIETVKGIRFYKADHQPE
ncbi:MAG: hypothetical protein WAK20_18785, partial [Candidatus Acidiferrum sp.]